MSIRLANGARIDCQGIPIAFNGEGLATVTWFWEGEHADDKTHTATFRWKDTGPITMTSGGYGRSYDIDLVAYTGEKPTTEIEAFLTDYVLASIPRYVERRERDR